MPSFIKKTRTGSGATAVQVVTKRGREVVGLKHIGSAHSEAQLGLLVAKAREVIEEGMGDLGLFPKAEEEGGCWVESSHSGLLWGALEGVWRRLGFEGCAEEVFKQLALARVIEPTSKADSARVIGGLGLRPPSGAAIHRCLARANSEDYRGLLSAKCLERARPEALTLVLYDVTTLYFEVQREDDYRKPGFSKERRIDPQICVGLLVDRKGFPLEVASFEGNKAEVDTIVPVLEAFARRSGHKATVTADAAMLSAPNLAALAKLGYGYIVGSRINKCPYEVEEFLKPPEGKLEDGQIFEEKASEQAEEEAAAAKKKKIKKKKNAEDGEQAPKNRVIYQWKEKRARLDLRNLDKAVEKAKRIVDGRTKAKSNRFVRTTGAVQEINTALVENWRKRAGIKGYVTNLEIPAQEVIDHYHQLFEVERSFRMAKGDLKARPIYHQTRQAIEAHLTVVFAALAVARHIQEATGLSIARFVRTLLPLRSAVVSVNGSKLSLEPRVPKEITALLKALENFEW